MRKMILRPDADGYSSADGADWIRSELDGGVGRYRRDKIGASKMVNVKWTMNPGQYEYWRAFYALVGSGAFLCDLVSEDGTGPKEHQCNIIPGSVNLPSQLGLTYIQQAQLEVKPLVRDAAADDLTVRLFEMTNGDVNGWYAALEKLTTVTIPNAEVFHA